MLNGANKKGMQNTHNVKAKNYPGTTSENILDKLDHLLKNKPDC